MISSDYCFGGHFISDPFYVSHLKKMLTFQSFFDDEFSLVEPFENGALIPRNLIETTDDDRRSPGYPIAVKNNFIARSSEQNRVVTSSTELLRADKSHIVEAPTGFGKTFVGSAIIGNLQVSTLIVVTKDDLKEQWKTALRSVLGLSDADIGLIQGDVFVAAKPVVIAMIQSLHKRSRYPAWVYKNFGLTIFDEVHLVGADQFSKVCWWTGSRLRLGLSATPDRKDGKEIVLKGHIGEVLVRTESIPMVPTILKIDTGFELFNPIVDPARTANAVKEMATDYGRVRLCATLAKQMLERKRNTVVFSSTLLMLDSIHDSLISLGVRSDQIGRYVGGMSEKDRDVNARKPIILATYNMTAQGTNRPWWDACILATPRADVAQSIGRILREYPDKPRPVVFDLVDDDPILKAFYRKRRDYYYKIGADIHNFRGDFYEQD